ncbi:MAG: tRNA lysidine(34) synthetase TilS, partial [Phycisphaerae bacterium]|nr:tRNA lysidine(34) synthetase TilS [Phycisphaerae bacterium]
CEARRCDVRAEADRRRESIELAGRRARYDFLLDVARQQRAPRVAVGHHADDQVETVLFRLVRGCHLRGAAGMRAHRAMGEGVVLVRPLLGVGRQEVEAYCRRRGLSWCQDASNTDRAFRRNLIRHEILPLLRQFNPQVDQAVLDLAAAAGEAEDVLQRLGQAALARATLAAQGRVGGAAGLDLAALGEEPGLVRRYVVRAALEQAGVPMGAVTTAHLRTLAAMGGGGGARAIDLPGGWSARVEGGCLVISRPSTGTVGPVWASWPAVTLACPGRTVLPDGRAVVCDLAALDRRAVEAHCRSGRHDVEWLDADAVQRPVLCRLRVPGDAFQPLGCTGRRKVGELLTDLKLPVALRRGVLCITDGRGVLACLPIRLDERAKVTEATRTVLRIGLLDAGAPKR